MDGFSIETQVERVGRVIAWLLFALVTCTIAYFELVDHEAITDGDWGGLIAHAPWRWSATARPMCWSAWWP
jgi:hypothetical protein